ncbi:hypothetical protein D3C85_1390160 [compost metagenome]
MPDLPRTQHVVADGGDAGRRAVVIVRQHRAALVAVGGHPGPAHRGHPQRLHESAVDAGQQVDLVVDLLEHAEVVRREDVLAGLRLDHDAHGIAQALHFVFVAQEVEDVRVLVGNGLEEAGIEFHPQGETGQHDGDQCAEQHDQEPVVEQQTLDQVAGARIELLQAGDRLEFLH